MDNQSRDIFFEPAHSLEDLAWPRDLNSAYHSGMRLSAVSTKKEVDMVNAPPHYDLGGLQVIDIRDILLDRIQTSGVLNYKQTDYWSRSWEYLTRFMEKGGAQDVKKAKYYLDRLVNSLEEKSK